MGPYKFNKTHLTNDEICTEETRETITTYIGYLLKCTELHRIAPSCTE